MNQNFAGKVMSTAGRTGLSAEEVQKRLDAQKMIDESGIYASGAAGACDFGYDNLVERLEGNMSVRALKNRQKIEENRLAEFESNRKFSGIVSVFAGAKRIGPPTAKAMGRHSESELQILRR